MQRIGSFTRKDEIFEGQVNTLGIQIDVRLAPNPDTDEGNTKAPDMLAFAGGAEIGAAWLKQEGGRPAFYTIRLDDPSWSAPLSAALFQNKHDSRRFDLVWSRHTVREVAAP